MDIEKKKVTKLRLTGLDSLDPVSVFAEDLGSGKGQVTIVCYGKAWTAYWGGISSKDIMEFFCTCDKHYIAKNLSNIDSEVYNLDAIQRQAKDRDIECWRDDPWNDYDFLEEMYGSNMECWADSIPKESNHKYEYLCRIILAVQDAFRTLKEEGE